MQLRILTDSSVTKIYLSYEDNSGKQKFPVKLRFSDDTDCYFVTEKIDAFNAPENNISAEIVVYTTDGLYRNNTTIHKTEISNTEITFAVALPEAWEYEQLRKSSRIVCSFPLTISCEGANDIGTTTYDISSGGISCYLEQPLTDSEKEKIFKLVLEIPCESTFSAQKLEFEAKCIREKLVENRNFCVFNFVNIVQETQRELRVILMRLDS